MSGRGAPEPVIIIPGQDKERDSFCYGMVTDVSGPRPIGTFMMKWPEAMDKPFGTRKEVTIGRDGVEVKLDVPAVMWMLKNRTEEATDSGFEVSRYEFHSLALPEGFVPIESVEDALSRDTRKDGYVYIPKQSRDGRHGDLYLVTHIEEQMFRTRTERGMYEEIAWSPYGNIDEAVRQEAKNLERNPLMRNWA